VDGAAASVVVVSAIVAAWLFAVAEFVTVGVIHAPEFTSSWELTRGGLFLAPVVLLGAASAALFGAACFYAVKGRGAALRIALALLSGAFAGTVTLFVATGRHFATAPSRSGVVVLMAGIAGAAAFAVQPWAARLRVRHPIALATAALAKAIVLETANRFVLVRLYPAFHVGLGVAALAAAAFAAAVLVSRAVPGAAEPWFRRPSAAQSGALVATTVVVVVALVSTARPAAARLAHFDNLRLLLVDHGPILGEGVRAAAWLSPPDPADEGDPCILDPQSCGGSAGTSNSTGGVDFSGRDIVLITIDALRADHLGTYGYARPTTPEIDALAKDAAVFERAYCPTPHTSYSVTSLMTGKYMRPLLLQGIGQDSETLATFLRTYGYRTAAFYPPAVFFIDQPRFTAFEAAHYGFEYAKVEFMEGEGRVAQVASYFGTVPDAQRLFLWVHLFGPHEPYEAHPEHPFGDRDVDRYDSEIAEADGAVGGIVRLVRAKRPNAVVIVTADHGEEFGDHGGRYHGTTVYEEQVRVPLIVSAPGLVAPRRIKEVVQTVDLVPTLLGALAIPPSPRIRGRDLGPLLAGTRADGPGFAFAETDDNALLAEGPLRLVCQRKLGACRLYDVSQDPTETADLRASKGPDLDRMRAELQAFGASHGRYERDGLRAETGKGWPAPIVRAIAGDADAAPELAPLLDDADRDIRRKAAELLFELGRPETTAAVRLALERDEDVVVRKWCALALTRLGETAPLTSDLLDDPDPRFRRNAALALAEQGDARGGSVLVDWWQHGAPSDYEHAVAVLAALAKIKDKDAVWPLVQSLGNVRLRPYIARTLAAIGDSTARGPLVKAFSEERYQTARGAIAAALDALGAKEELARPLLRFLGVPDPLQGGVGYAEDAKVLQYVGGPDDKGLAALRRQSNVGVLVQLVVPKGGNGKGVRVVVRARASEVPGEVRVGKRLDPIEYDRKGNEINARQVPKIHDRDFASVKVPVSASFVEVSATLPDSLGVRPGRAVELVVFAERSVTLDGLVVVPLADELPPPPPEPWSPDGAQGVGVDSPAGRH
jgi:arylsulfatase A-like enzyme